MAEAPIIETTRLRLVPFSRKHLTPAYVCWLNDPEVVRFSEQRHRKHSLETCKQYYESFSGTPHLFWAITTIDPENEHIGNMNAYVDTFNSVADIGILIGDRTVWGKGFGLEAWTAVCRYLLREADIRKVTAGTLAPNSGMLKIMEKSGMISDGRRSRHYLVGNKEVDVVYAAMFKTNLEGNDK